MNKIFICAAIIIGLNCFNIFGQTPRKTPTSKPSPTPEIQTSAEEPGIQGLPKLNVNPLTLLTPSLETILTEAEKQIINYRNTFKDLLATETKTFEKFDKDENSKKQTIVESDFLVYQSAKDAEITSELRNVIKVDGKTVPDALSRTQRLFAELQKTNSVKSELEKIQKEGSRYDKTLDISGLTLFEGGVLLDKLRPYFDFQMSGAENYQGNEVYIISYRQTKKSPFVVINGKDEDEDKAGFSFRFDLPVVLKNSDAFLRGKLWIDRQTFQIRREEREVTVQADTPLVVLAADFDYQPSDYGILVPQKISLLSNKIEKNDGKYETVKNIKVSFDYSKFRKTNTDVKVLDGD